MLRTLTTTLLLFACIPVFSQAVLVKDINPGAADGATQYRERYIALQGKLLFTANDGQNGEELWVSDGTTAGTQMLKDIYPGAIGSLPQNFTEFQGKVYFSAENDANGREVWVTDGTPAGTQLFREFNPDFSSGNVDFIGVANNKLFVRATFDATHQLWVTDGAANSFISLAEADFGFSTQKNIATGTTKVYFTGPDNALWVTDGSVMNTQKLKDSPSFFTVYNQMAVINDKLFYGLGASVYSTEPWVSDGTPAGTFLLLEMLPGEFDGGAPTYFIGYNNLVYFRGANQLWRTDGTVAGTTLFKDNLRPFGNINFDGREGLVFNNKLFFTGEDDQNGEELWSTNGTLPGTTLFKQLNSGFLSAGPSLFTPAGDGHFYFNAYTGTSDYALWKSDGTANGTVKVADPYPGNNAENLWAIVPAGNNLFFATRSAANGNELWKVGITTATSTPAAVLGKVWPNPVADVLHVTLHDQAAPAMLRLFDVLGQLQLEQEWQPAGLPVANLPTGQYFLQVQSTFGVQVAAVVIQR